MVVEGIDGGWPTSLPNDGWTVYYNSGLELQGSSDFTKLITYCKVFDVVSAGGSASALGGKSWSDSFVKRHYGGLDFQELTHPFYVFIYILQILTSKHSMVSSSATTVRATWF